MKPCCAEERVRGGAEEEDTAVSRVFGKRMVDVRLVLDVARVEGAPGGHRCECRARPQGNVHALQYVAELGAVVVAGERCVNCVPLGASPLNAPEYPCAAKKVLQSFSLTRKYTQQLYLRPCHRRGSN